VDRHTRRKIHFRRLIRPFFPREIDRTYRRPDSAKASRGSRSVSGNFPSEGLARRHVGRANSRFSYVGRARPTSEFTLTTLVRARTGLTSCQESVLGPEEFRVSDVLLRTSLFHRAQECQGVWSDSLVCRSSNEEGGASRKRHLYKDRIGTQTIVHRLGCHSPRASKSRG
jgi:hypothetical protein